MVCGPRARQRVVGGWGAGLVPGLASWLVGGGCALRVGEKEGFAPRRRRAGAALPGLLLLALAMVPPLALRGQELAGQTPPPYIQAISIGVRGGYGFNSISIRPHQSTNSGSSLEVGLYAAFRSTRHLALVLTPSLKRTTYTSTYPIPLTEGVPAAPIYTAQQEWAYLPLLLEARIHLAWVSLIASAGPYADYLLRETVRGAAGVPVAQALHSTQRNRLGLGLIGGGGVGINTRWGSIVIEYRAGYRLTNLYLTERQPKLQEPRSNLNDQSVGVSYYYTFSFDTP